MRIAIIGTGRVGTALSRSFGSAGHDITLGSRTPDDRRLIDTSIELGAAVMTPAEAAQWAEVVVIAVPWGSVRATVEDVGDLGGRILIDATNPVPMGDPAAVLPSELGFRSGAEAIAAWAPSARVVKAFNTTGSANLANPTIAGFPVPALICGASGDTATVAELAGSAGFEPIVVGELDQAPLVEAAALLWITLAYQHGMGPDYAFVIARR